MTKNNKNYKTDRILEVVAIIGGFLGFCVFPAVIFFVLHGEIDLHLERWQITNLIGRWQFILFCLCSFWAGPAVPGLLCFFGGNDRIKEIFKNQMNVSIVMSAFVISFFVAGLFLGIANDGPSAVRAESSVSTYDENVRSICFFFNALGSIIAYSMGILFQCSSSGKKI